MTANTGTGILQAKEGTAMAEQEKRRTGRSTHGMSIEELVKTYYGIKGEVKPTQTPEERKAMLTFLEEQRDRDRAKRNTGK